MKSDKSEKSKNREEPQSGDERRKGSPPPSAAPPDDGATGRPVLKVKPVGSRDGDEGAKPKVRAGTLYSGDGNSKEHTPAHQDSGDLHLQKTIIVPRMQEGDPRYLYATHRPPPADAAAEKEELAVAGGAKPEKRISAGFVLGVALIVVALFSGVFIARLGKKVRALEQRVSRLEGTAPTAVASSTELR